MLNDTDTEFLLDFVNPDGSITISWHIADVQEVRRDLTENEARLVLGYCNNNHDACTGITWETLEYAAEILFPEDSEND